MNSIIEYVFNLFVTFFYFLSGTLLIEKKKPTRNCAFQTNKVIDITIDFSDIGVRRFISMEEQEKKIVSMKIGSNVIKTMEGSNGLTKYMEKTRVFFNVVEHATHCR